MGMFLGRREGITWDSVGLLATGSLVGNKLQWIFYRNPNTFIEENAFGNIVCKWRSLYTTKLLGGYTGFTPSVRPSVRLSVRPSVRPSRMPCPLCIIYSYGWILFILGTNDHYHERVCRAPWPLTLTYIFKVIWPWLRKSCPLCSVYSSGWILPIFGTNDHYH